MLKVSNSRSHVKYEFTNTKKLVKKLARIETSSICRQQFANVFANFLSSQGRFGQLSVRATNLFNSPLICPLEALEYRIRVNAIIRHKQLPEWFDLTALSLPESFMGLW